MNFKIYIYFFFVSINLKKQVIIGYHRLNKKNTYCVSLLCMYISVTQTHVSCTFSPAGISLGIVIASKEVALALTTKTFVLLRVKTTFC